MLCQYVSNPKIDVLSIEAVTAGWTIVKFAVDSTLHLYQAELGESEQQEKVRIIYEFICKRGGSVKHEDVLTSKKLTGQRGMYQAVLDTLLEEGRITVDNTRGKKADWIYRVLK